MNKILTTIPGAKYRGCQNIHILDPYAWSDMVK